MKSTVTRRRRPGWFDAVMPQPGAPLMSGRWLMILVIIAAVALAALNASLLPAVYGVLVPIAFLITALHSASLLLALTRPWLAVASSTISVAATVPATLGDHGPPWPVPVVTLILVTLISLVLAVRETWPLPVAAAGGAALVASAWGLLLRLFAGAPAIGANLITFASILALVVAFGIVVRQWVSSRSAALHQLQRAEAETERRQVVEERSRIARELHDVVAHSLSIISIQASTVQYRIPDVPPAVVTELDGITHSAREALVEMRGLLQVLRQEDGTVDLAPQPTVSRIPELVENTRRSARTVHFEVTGQLDDGVFSEVNSLSAYRIVQEALSNAVRHAPDTEISVHLTVDPQALTIHVENTAPERVSHQPGSGLGQRGMRERAAAAGGTVRTGPTAEGGYAVHAVLPLRRAEH
ncbi:sensor histidine kinase [Propionibacteriaceae bacterium Y1685]|uniref:sensor histidine kinase n=1 Tax=Microlunatus sp. Y1700 TaxID=3418487 RepID=UPI003B7D3903